MARKDPFEHVGLEGRERHPLARIQRLSPLPGIRLRLCREPMDG
jgi:hypothetical protein